MRLRINSPAMSRAPALPFPQALFARAKKARRVQKAEEPPLPMARPERLPPAVKLVLAGAAVVLLFFALRLQNPQPWSYDEYYHLGLAREMLTSGLRIPSFHWTPFSITYDHFADGEPLFHLLLLPFARLPLQTAGMLGVLLGQIFLVGSFAAALWIVRAPRPWWLVLALGGLGTLFAQRMEMCRPHVWLIGFTMLVAALLVERRWKALFVVCALFALTHAGAWIAVPLAILWSLCGLIVPGEPRESGERRIPWRPVAVAAGGWLLGQLLNPDLPENFRLFAITNFVIPFQATAAGNAALRSQLGTELSPPGLDLLLEQWPAFIAPVLVAVALLSRPRLRDRATLTVGLTSLAFLLAGSFAIRRFFELGAPLALLALALVAREWRRKGLPSPLPGWGRLAAGTAMALGILWTFLGLRAHGVQDASAPIGMAAWLGRHGAAGRARLHRPVGGLGPPVLFRAAAPVAGGPGPDRLLPQGPPALRGLRERRLRAGPRSGPHDPRAVRGAVGDDPPGSLSPTPEPDRPHARGRGPLRRRELPGGGHGSRQAPRLALLGLRHEFPLRELGGRGRSPRGSRCRPGFQFFFVSNAIMLIFIEHSCLQRAICNSW